MKLFTPLTNIYILPTLTLIGDLIQNDDSPYKNITIHINNWYKSLIKITTNHN